MALFFYQFTPLYGHNLKCVLVTDKSSKNGTLSVNLDEIFIEFVDQHHFKKIVFHTQKSKKCITNSTANRLPSFGISFNSSKKRTFFRQMQSSD